MRTTGTIDWPNVRTSRVMETARRFLARIPMGSPAKDFIFRNLAKVVPNPFVSVAVGPYRLKVDCRETFHRAMALGRYDPELERVFKETLRPGDVYVDVGSEIGYTACLAGSLIKSSGTMLLFEPDPRPRARLIGHLASVGRADTPRTHVFEEACSDRVQEIGLVLEEISGQSRIAESAAGPRHTIRTVVLDDTLRDLGIESVRLLKMDVEGHEIHAIRGMLRALKGKAIDYVVVERNKGLLWTNGYTPFHLHALFTFNGYSGMTDSGEIISAEGLDSDTLNNLVYAKSPELLARIFPAGRDVQPFVPKKYYIEAINPDYPGAEVRNAVDLASHGKIDEAIAKATDLIKAHPYLVNLKGHLGYWLKLQGRHAESTQILSEIAAIEPDNPFAREAIDKNKNH